MSHVEERSHGTRRLVLPRNLVIDRDPTWIVDLPDDVPRERVAESLGALAEGGMGLRGAREEGGPGTSPLFVAAGVFSDGPVPRLLPGPNWTHLASRAMGLRGRFVHLREGMLVRDDASSGLRSVRLLSAAHPGVGVLLASAPTGRLEVADPFSGEPAEVDRRSDGGIWLARTRSTLGGGIAVGVQDEWATDGDLRTLARVAAWVRSADVLPDWDEVVSAVTTGLEVGVDALVAEHRSVWAERWSRCDVTIEGDAEAQLAARFAVFHLLGAAAGGGEAAVGPRGLTGPAYGGHVFWDADVYVQPALAALHPGGARAMVEYRIRRLPAARAAAAAHGLEGARFPWESAHDGTDVTPQQVEGQWGVTFAVTTGEQEEHIVADVAWAADHLVRWSGDSSVLAGPGRGLVVDTARYWASRIRLDGDGRGHLDDVMGPDEYHPVVDDNAFTNVMARWNLRRGADLLDDSGEEPAMAARWRDLAARLADGWDPTRGTYEQFAGFWQLEPLVADIAPRPYAADMLLGQERVAGSQLIKQPDVLMLHHMVPEEVEPGSLRASLDTYEPRTTHGSSLSPAIVAGLLARDGRPDAALEPFCVASGLDLRDLTGTTAGGLHLATMGALWQALTSGFLGLRPEGEHLAIDPCLPSAWASVSVSLQFRGCPLAITVAHEWVRVACDQAVLLRLGDAAPVLCRPPGSTYPWARRRPSREEVR